jgi:hypothetical protein
VFLHSHCEIFSTPASPIAVEPIDSSVISFDAAFFATGAFTFGKGLLCGRIRVQAPGAVMRSPLAFSRLCDTLVVLGPDQTNTHGK